MPSVLRQAVALLGMFGGLTAAEQAPQPPPPVSIPDAVDLDVCRLTTSIAPDQFDGLKTYVVSHLVTPSGVHIDVTESGTAHIAGIRTTDAAGNTQEPAWPDPGSEVAVVGEGLRLLPYRGRVYILNYMGRDAEYLGSIFRLNDDNSMLPICRMAPQTSVSFSPARESDESVCRAVEAGTVTYVPEQRYRRPSEVKGDYGYGQATAVAEVTVDYRNDGRPRRLQRYEVSSNAGAGCEASRFLPAGKQSLPDVDVLVQLEDKTSSFTGPRFWAPCTDAPERWFNHRGKLFLEAKSQASKSPRDEQDEYHIVSTVEAGKPRRVCEARYIHLEPQWTRVWNGKGWATPPRP